MLVCMAFNQKLAIFIEKDILALSFVIKCSTFAQSIARSTTTKLSEHFFICSLLIRIFIFFYFSTPIFNEKFLIIEYCYEISNAKYSIKLKKLSEDF